MSFILQILALAYGRSRRLPGYPLDRSIHILSSAAQLLEARAQGAYRTILKEGMHDERKERVSTLLIEQILIINNVTGNETK